MNKLVTLLSVSLVLMPFVAGAYEPIRYEEPCRRTGMPAPVRQTVVVVDEGALRSQASAGSKNVDRRWIRAVVELADAREGVTTNNMEPSERFVVVVARANGSELVPLFIGCSPNLTKAEFDKRSKEDSATDKFFGRDTASLLKRQIEAFQSRILEALTQVVNQIERDEKGNVPIEVEGLHRALVVGGRLVDLSFGMPRILIVSDFRFADTKKLGDRESARKAGFEAATRIGLDFARAEMHVMNVGGASNQYLRDYTDALLLGSKGLLVGWRTDGLPSLPQAPIAVRYFGGTIDYAGLPAPVQMRLAFDGSGSLVNSWIEVTVTKAVATPMAGKAICQGTEVCEVKGDGKLFSQIWNAAVSAEPRFGEELPFAGLRYFEFSTSKEEATGRIFDPKAKIRMENDPKALVDAFTIKLRITPGQVF